MQFCDISVKRKIIHKGVLRKFQFFQKSSKTSSACSDTYQKSIIVCISLHRRRIISYIPGGKNKMPRKNKMPKDPKTQNAPKVGEKSI